MDPASEAPTPALSQLRRAVNHSEADPLNGTQSLQADSPSTSQRYEADVLSSSLSPQADAPLAPPPSQHTNTSDDAPGQFRLTTNNGASCLTAIHGASWLFRKLVVVVPCAADSRLSRRARQHQLFSWSNSQIRSVALPGLCLDTLNASTAPGTPLILTQCKELIGGRDRQWALDAVTDVAGVRGSHVMMEPSRQLCLDVARGFKLGSVLHNRLVVLYPCLNQHNQAWNLERMAVGA